MKQTMLELILILLAISFVIVGGTAFFIVKYYWGPGGRPGGSSKAGKTRAGQGGRG